MEFTEKLERGFECVEVDTSKYDLNTGQSSQFFKLAKEIVSSVLIHVNVADLVSFSMVCRQFKQWSDDSHIWVVQYLREYGTIAKTESAKKQLAVKWHTQVNMRKGKFISSCAIQSLTRVKLVRCLPEPICAFESGG